jgi:hypothetical protein
MRGAARGAQRRWEWLASAAAVVLSAPAAGIASSQAEVRAVPLSAAQIVAKSVVARGGLEAWRQIDTMVWVGHMEVANGPEPRLGFLLEQKRPNKTHFEIDTWAAKSVRIFDGEHGWKARADHEGHPEVHPYERAEVEFARDAQVIDGPLVDYQSKGITVTLAGVEPIEGKPAYRLAVQLPSGTHEDIWVDAKSFLEVKYDRTSVGPSGRPGVVSVMYRNYQTTDGIKIPRLLEIGAGSKAPDKMVIEKVDLNPPLQDAEFSNPGERHSVASRKRQSNPTPLASPAAAPAATASPSP